MITTDTSRLGRHRIGVRLTAGFAVALGGLAAVGAVSLVSVGSLEENQSSVEHTYQVLGQIEAVTSSLKDGETGQRGYLITGVDAYLDPFHAGKQGAEEHLDNVAELTSDNAEQQQRIERLRPLVDAKFAEMQETIDLRRAQGFAPAREVVLTNKGKAVMDEIRGVLGEMSDAETSLLEVRSKDTKQTASITRTTIIFGSLLVLLVVVGLAWRLTRGITRPLTTLGARLREIADGDGDLTARVDDTAKDETGEVARAFNRFIERMQGLLQQMAKASSDLSIAVGEIGGVSGDLTVAAAGVSEQATSAAAAAEQISRSVQTVSSGSEQLGASIREIAVSASDAAQVAGQAVELAAGASQTVTGLSDSSNEIGNVIALITSIAEQTNLLALNATIEAARAGESGKGFAVVASEVKELAQATARATGDITKRIESIQGDAQATESVIKNIAEVIGRINDHAATIASAVEEQSATTGEITRSVNQAAEGSTEIASNIATVASAAQQTAASGTTAQQTSDGLDQLAAQMREAINRYRF